MYRTEQPKPRKHESHAFDLSTDTIIDVVNGIISRIAFPCYYMYREDGLPLGVRTIPPAVWDHLGWPQPGRRDHSWQPCNIEGLVIEPIKLEDEGYDLVQLVMKDAPEGLDAYVEIDGSIIRLTLDIMCRDAIENEVKVPYSLYASGTFEDDVEARDLVTKGIIRIHPTINEEE